MKDTMPPIRSFESIGRTEVTSWIEISNGDAVPVESFTELMDCVAELSYLNPHLNLFFRGQLKNYGSDGSIGPNEESSLLPQVYRKAIAGNKKTREDYFQDVLPRRTERLKDWLRKSNGPQSRFARRLSKDIEQFPETLWAILQHYECPTPLLDITQSLHVAASFATYEYKTDKVNDKDGYVYVLGLPNITSYVSFFAYEGIVIVKLQAACPPQAKRPHYQQGFLVGSIPHNPKPHTYSARDVQQRLVAKFRIANSAEFWDKTSFTVLPKSILMPDDEVADAVRKILGETQSLPE